jgi:hypothetical protein
LATQLQRFACRDLVAVDEKSGQKFFGFVFENRLETRMKSLRVPLEELEPASVAVVLVAACAPVVTK